MSRTDVWGIWSDIQTITDWLDDNNQLTDHEITLRILKLVEEVGEAAQARIGQTAQNPRKGQTHTELDVIGELCDVVITAMVAINSITGNALVSRGHLASKMTAVLTRIHKSAAETPVAALDAEGATAS